MDFKRFMAGYYKNHIIFGITLWCILQSRNYLVFINKDFEARVVCNQVNNMQSEFNKVANLGGRLPMELGLSVTQIELLIPRITVLRVEGYFQIVQGFGLAALVLIQVLVWSLRHNFGVFSRHFVWRGIRVITWSRVSTQSDSIVIISLVNINFMRIIDFFANNPPYEREEERLLVFLSPTMPPICCVKFQMKVCDCLYSCISLAYNS